MSGTWIPNPAPAATSFYTLAGSGLLLDILQPGGWGCRMDGLNDPCPQTPPDGFPLGTSGGILDRSPTGAYGVCGNNVNSATDATFGKVWTVDDQFSGSTSLTIPTGGLDAVQNSRAFWIALTIKPTKSTQQFLLTTCAAISGANGFAVWITGGKLAFTMRNGSSSVIDEETIASLTTGHWYDIQITGPAALPGKCNYYVTDLTAASGFPGTPVVPVAIQSGVTLNAAGTGTGGTLLEVLGTAAASTFQGSCKNFGVANFVPTQTQINNRANFIA